MAALDRQLLHARLGDDTGLIAELLQMLLEDAPRLAHQCQQALDAGALDDAYRAAHTLKGAAGNMCAVPVMSAVSRVEALAGIGDLDGARAAGEVLLREVRALEAELRPIVANGAAVSVPRAVDRE